MTKMRDRCRVWKEKRFTTAGRERFECARFYGGTRWKKIELRAIDRLAVLSRGLEPFQINMIRLVPAVDGGSIG